MEYPECLKQRLGMLYDETDGGNDRTCVRRKGLTIAYANYGGVAQQSREVQRTQSYRMRQATEIEASRAVWLSVVV